MGIKDAVNKSKGLTVAVSICVILLCIWFNFIRSTENHGDIPNGIWIYEPESGEITMLPPKTYPPVGMENGKKGYRAEIYSCSKCGDRNSWEIAYLFKYSDKAKSAYDRGITREDIGVISSPNAELVATVKMAEEGKWVPAESARVQMLEKASDMCGGGYSLCKP